MGNYNPDDPCTLGLQWFAHNDDVGFLSSDSTILAYALEAATGDEIKELWTMFCAVFGSNTGIVLEIYDITDGPPPLPPLSQIIYYPTSDAYVAPAPWGPGAWGSFNGWNVTAAPLGPFWEAIDNVSLVPYTWTLSGQYVDNNEFIFNLYGRGYDFSVRFGSIAGTQDGRWITRLQSRFTVGSYWAYSFPGYPTLRPYLYMNGRKFFGPAISASNAREVQPKTFDWWFNPLTGLPWTVGDIEAFDTEFVGGNNYSMGWMAQPTNSSNALCALLQGQMVIESAATDPRLGMAVINNPRQQGWQRFVLRSIEDATAANLTLVPGNKYLFAFRRGAGTANIGLCRLEDPDQFLPGPPNWTSYNPTVDPVTHRITSLGPELGKVIGVSLKKTNNQASLDSQPYITSSPLDGVDAWPYIGEAFDNSPVNSVREIQQEFTPDVTDAYGWVWVLCAQVTNTTNGDLIIRIRRRSDDVQMGGDAVIVVADLAAPRHSWQKIGARLDGIAPTLVNGTQYYFDITSPADSQQGWLVQVLNSGFEPPPTGPPAGTSKANYGGDVNVLTLVRDSVPTEIDEMDAEITISTVPDTPTGFAVEPAGATCGVNPALISWDTYTDESCGGFAAYEIERLMPTGVWHRIARPTDVNVVAIADREAPNNKLTSWRMRVIRADGAPSDWTPTVTATLTTPGFVGLTFTSNVAPEMTVFYEDIARRVFGFPQNVDVFEPQDQDFVVVYRELPNRGTRISTKLRIRDGHIPCMPHGCDDFDNIGAQVFEPLKAIARAGLPYVCVKNEAGDVWLAFVTTPTGDWDQHGIEVEGGWAGYTMDVTITEVTNVPYAFDAEAPGS